MIRVFTRQIQKLHSQEGQALVFVAMVGLVIFLFFAMTMNLAEVVNIKIKNQNTADAAALSAAVWQARVLNTVSAFNDALFLFYGAVIFTFLSVLASAGGCFLCLYLFVFLGGLDPGFCAAPCGAAILFVAVFIGTLLAVGGIADTQDEVLNTFDLEFIIEDLASILDLNYGFKPHTEHLDTEVFLFLNENNGNLFLEDAGGAGQDFLLERGGWCELIIGLYYNLCRNGFIDVCGPFGDTWEAGMQAFYESLIPENLWYHPGGECLGSPADDYFVFPYVLRTFTPEPFAPHGFLPVAPEPVLPITTGVFRERRPPVLHLQGADPDCEDPRRFPCTDAGHFSFAMAHAYSPSVADFYAHLVGLGPAFATVYPIPLAPTFPDWEGRLFPLEPLMEQGLASDYAGRQAYEDIAAQAEALGAEDFLLQNVLVPRDGLLDFFLY